ncbi:MAG: CpsB/CapC family capsule biosynthesis tyrosine phosphatase [Veillonella parvula]|nr:CpsB/CapC family capsule biosynthesis tyrosine phosphatase [Veillonella parvula]
MAESVKMIKSLSEQGITDIFSTPDVTVSMDLNTWNAMNSLVNEVKVMVKEQQVDITIHSGARVMLCDEMVAYIASHRNQYTLGDSHFILVALPQNSKVHHINAWLLSLLDMGLVPIISEVETYGQLFTKPEQLLAWVDRGILIQCNMASFDHGNANYDRAIEAYQGYVEAISELDNTYKKDLLPNIHLNERDLLANRTFYPSVPSSWVGKKGNFLTRLFGFAL